MTKALTTPHDPPSTSPQVRARLAEALNLHVDERPINTEDLAGIPDGTLKELPNAAFFHP